MGINQRSEECCYEKCEHDHCWHHCDASCHHDTWQEHINMNYEDCQYHGHDCSHVDREQANLNRERDNHARREQLNAQEKNCHDEACHLDIWEQRIIMDEENCHYHGHECHHIEEQRRHLEEAPSDEELHELAEVVDAPIENIMGLHGAVMEYMATHDASEVDVMNVVMELAPEYGLTMQQVEQGMAHMENRAVHEDHHGPSNEELHQIAEHIGAPIDSVMGLHGAVMEHIAMNGHHGDEHTMEIVHMLAPNYGITSEQVQMAMAHMEGGEDHHEEYHGEEHYHDEHYHEEHYHEEPHYEDHHYEEEYHNTAGEEPHYHEEQYHADAMNTGHDDYHH